MLDQTKAARGQQPLLASTNGWDTVYGIRFPKVNQAIAAAKSSPEDFKFTEEASGETNVISGVFGDWSLTGGSGALLTMTVPIPHFTYVPDQEKLITRTDAVATIEVSLEAIPQPTGDTANPDDGVLYDLKLKTNAGRNDKGAQTVDVKSFSYPGMEDDGDIPSEVRLLLQQWMRTGENLQRFNHTFATVKLNAKAAVDDFDWLMPTYLGYGVIGETGTDTGVFAVLCMTEDRNPPMDERLSTDLVPSGKEAAFLISNERYLQKMVLPGMMWMFDEPENKAGKTWPDDYFEISSTQLKNAFPLTIKSFEIGKDNVEATLPAGQLILTMEQNFMSYEMSGLKHPYWGAWYDVTHKISTRLFAEVNDSQQFTLYPVAQSEGGNVVEHDAAIEKTPLGQTVAWALLAADIAAVLFPLGKLAYARYAATGTAATATAGGAVAQTAEATAAGAVGPLAAGANVAAQGANAGTFVQRNWAIINGVAVAAMTIGFAAEEIYQSMANENNWGTDAIPNVNDFVSNIMAPVQWPEAAEFTVESVSFNGGLHIIGTQEI